MAKVGKRIIRTLIENVVVSSPEDGLKAEFHWTGGEVSTVEVIRVKSGIHRYVTDQKVEDLVRELAKEFSDVEIARILHFKGFKTFEGNPFTRIRITWLRRTDGISIRHQVRDRAEPKAISYYSEGEHFSLPSFLRRLFLDHLLEFWNQAFDGRGLRVVGRKIQELLQAVDGELVLSLV